MAQSHGRNHNLVYDPSTDRITTALGGGLQPCGYMRGKIGEYQLDFRFMNFRYGWRAFEPKAGIDGEMSGRDHYFSKAQMFNEGVLSRIGTHGRLVGGVCIGGEAYELATRGSIYTGQRADMEMVLAQNTRRKVTERNQPLLEDYLHIATIAMLFDIGERSFAEGLISEWF